MPKLVTLGLAFSLGLVAAEFDWNLPKGFPRPHIYPPIIRWTAPTLRPEDIGKFLAPTLRNIVLRAPYMHDGSLTTLEEVIDHYAASGKMDHPNKSRILRPFRLTEAEKRDLIEFLRSLTDEELLHDPRWSDPWVEASSRERH